MNAYFRIAACIFFASAFSASDAAAQPVVVTEAETVALSSAAPRTATETMQDFIRSEESRVCSELKKFARQTMLKDSAVLNASEERNTSDMMEAADKYARILAKDFDAEYLFYYPNTRFFVRVGDKNYRGRMRIPGELSETSSSCFWERLPSDDVVYSVLLKLKGEKSGYIKISKALPRMVGNLPDALSGFGKVRVYTALDKIGLNKMAWFKMRRREANPTVGAGWCTAENLAFLSSIGSGRKLEPKTQKKILSLIDLNQDFSYEELNLTGGTFPVVGIDGQRLGAIVYTITPEETAVPKIEDKTPNETDAKK